MRRQGGVGQRGGAAAASRLNDERGGVCLSKGRGRRGEVAGDVWVSVMLNARPDVVGWRMGGCRLVEREDAFVE